MLQKLLIIIVGILLLCIAYSVVNIVYKLQRSKSLVAAAEVFEKNSVTEQVDSTPSLLVLGDSTAVGVGASTPEDSVAGLISAHINAVYVENHGVSGATTEDVLTKQLQHITQDSYTIILIQVGGNDIIRFHDVEKVSAQLKEILQMLPNAERVYITSVGNVGDATFFPFPIRPLYTKISMSYHAHFDDISSNYGAIYINLNQPLQAQKFKDNPERYYASDGLHPSSEGYALWFDIIEPFLSPVK